MSLRILRLTGALLLPLLFGACTPTTLSNGPSAGHLQADSVAKPQGAIPQPVQQSVYLPKPRAIGKTEIYSVVVNNVQVHDLLFALARDARLNVDVHPGLTGRVTLNAIDQTLPQLLSRIAKQVDMRFELDGPNLAVMPDTPYLKSYTVDYVNVARNVEGTVSTNTQISTGATAGAGAPGGGNTSLLEIKSVSKNRFWESLEKNIKDILQEADKERILFRRTADTAEKNSGAANVDGSAKATGAAAVTSGDAAATRTQSVEARASGQSEASRSQEYKQYETVFAASVILNPETGVVSVRATTRQHEKVQEFIARVMNSARRQVLIEATIIEVTLSDGYQQGIEWNRLTSGTDYSVTRPTVTTNVPNPVSPYVLRYRNINPVNLVATVDLLRSFGTVKVLSSPTLTVLNNQTATLKVSEEFVYFSVASNTTTTANVGTTVGITTTPKSVSVGFFMSLTAQISDSDTVTLNVRPSISSISELKRDPNPIIPSSIPNYVPQIKTREIESLMRIESGDIAVLGGLMEDRLDNKAGRFPGLGDIPFLGEVLNTRSNSSAKTELVVLLRPTVIHDASIDGDFRNFRDSLPNREFFKSDQVYRPFSLPERHPVPLQ
ncbi:MAG: type II and III secretion system protein [Accumulibacter sp.]|uniref:type II secretion system protein GspD n=1 Tax=Accumulibacter sp. TaxID=2053492 RepID=UPI0033156BC0